MDERTKLMGLARFSPRLNLLAKLARSENPILSISAMYLLRDRTARHVGGIFEFLFIVILPFLTILMVYNSYTISQVYGLIMLGYQNWPTSFTQIFSPFLELIAYVYGFILLVLPGNAIIRHESDDSTLRNIPLNANEIFRDLLKLQLISFLLIPAIYYLLKFVVWLVAFLIIVGAHALSRYVEETLGLATCLAFLFFICVYSIYAGLRYRIAWISFLVLLTGVALYLLMYHVVEILIVRLWFEGLVHVFRNDPSVIVFNMRMILIIIIILSVALVSRSLIVSRINPSR